MLIAIASASVDPSENHISGVSSLQVGTAVVSPEVKATGPVKSHPKNKYEVSSTDSRVYDVTIFSFHFQSLTFCIF